jgi:hypothetical protein
MCGRCVALLVIRGRWNEWALVYSDRRSADLLGEEAARDGEVGD